MSKLIKRPIGTWRVAEVDIEHNECEMSKSIYHEALDIVVDSFQDPQDEDDDCYMFNRKQMNKISKALEKAKNQDKLLGLYEKLVDHRLKVINNLLNDISDILSEVDKYAHHDIKIVEKIRELEMVDNEKESTDIFEPRFEVGEVVIYQNGDRFELGIIKTVERHKTYNDTSYKYRVWYHTGETTAMTDEHLLKKISNLYAFKIKRYDTEGKVIDE